MRGVPNDRRAPRAPIPRLLSVEADPRKDEARKLGEEIRDWLRQRDAWVESPCDADVQIVLGGDGSVVRAARTTNGVPVIGLDFGHFGFLAHVPPDRWQQRLTQVLKGNYVLREDATLRVTLERGRQVLSDMWAVQDVVFHAYVVTGNGQQMAQLDLYIDGKHLNVIPGDGLIIATAPGSSAYNLSAGGSVLTPGGGVFSVTPISPHTPMRSSFAVPEQTPISVVQNGRFAINVCVDGQETFDTFEPGDIAHVRADPRRFRLVSFRDVNFLDRFRQRFNYRIRPGHRAARTVRPPED